MLIKPAHNEKQSTTLKAARQSDKFAIGLAIAGFVCCAGWFVAHKDIKDKVTPVALFGFGGVGVVFWLTLRQIKDGRRAVGDLNEAFEAYALLTPENEMRLGAVGEYVNGTKPLAEMPIVQNILTAQVEQRVSDRIAEMERVTAIGKPAKEEKLKIAQVPLSKVTLEHLSEMPSKHLPKVPEHLSVINLLDAFKYYKG